MSLNSIQPTTAATLAQTMTTRFDTDGDGKLSAQEFTAALTRAMSSTTAGVSVPKNSGAASTPIYGSTDLTPRARINQILSAYPDTAAGLERALPELLSAILGIRLNETGSSGSGKSEPTFNGDYRKYVSDVLAGYKYGPDGLKAAEAQLNRAGIKLQIASNGDVRGRLFLPDGRKVDVIDYNEGLDWWTRPTGSNWGWTER